MTTTAPGRQVCKHCGEEIEYEMLAGWVDKRSGDDGGTYDICAATWDADKRRHNKHKPFEYLMP